MNPAERVPLIKKIAARMAETPIEDDVLVLQQFGLEPRYAISDGEIDSFTGSVASIQGASDDVLLGLHEYFFGEVAPSRHARPTAIDGVWDADKLRLFVSHTHPHKATVGALKLGLAARGIDAFVAHDDIEPTREWQDVIESALATCDAMVAWLTDDFPSSRWTDQEVGFAVARSVLIIPVRQEIDPYGFIGKFQGLRGVQERHGMSAGRDLSVITGEISDIVSVSDLTASRYVGPATHAFASAGSFDMARATYKTLTQLPRAGWTDDLLDVLERAAVENSQITHGVYEREPIPDLLEAFIAERRSATSATR